MTLNLPGKGIFLINKSYSYETLSEDASPLCFSVRDMLWASGASISHVVCHSAISMHYFASFSSFASLSFSVEAGIHSIRETFSNDEIKREFIFILIQ